MTEAIKKLEKELSKIYVEDVVFYKQDDPYLIFKIKNSNQVKLVPIGAGLYKIKTPDYYFDYVVG